MLCIHVYLLIVSGVVTGSSNIDFNIYYHITNLTPHCLTLTMTFVDLQKADKRQLEGKVNRSLFDSTTDELNKMIQDILNKLGSSVR